MPDELELEVFRGGDYGPKGAWSEQDIEALAADYDPARHEAPVTLDHAQRGPALGWVTGLRRVGDRLLARLRGVGDRLGQLLGSGAYKKRSVELYRAIEPTGRPYLKAVSLLGAAAPEVKGLADPSQESTDPEPAPLFAEDDPPHTAIDLDPEPAAPSIRFDEAAARLRRAGKWRPEWSGGHLERFWQALATAEPVRPDGDGDPVPADRWFLGFLEGLPPAVHMDEAAPAEPPAPATDPTLPDGPNVDPDSAALHRAAVRFQQHRPALTYAEALTACARLQTKV